MTEQDTPLPTPEEFRDKALRDFQKLAKAKFDAGQKAHGGNILNRWLVNEAKNEVLDLWFYVCALEHKLSQKYPFDDN